MRIIFSLILSPELIQIMAISCYINNVTNSTIMTRNKMSTNCKSDQSSPESRQCPWRRESLPRHFQREVRRPTIKLIETCKMSSTESRVHLSNKPTPFTVHTAGFSKSVWRVHSRSTGQHGISESTSHHTVFGMFLPNLVFALAAESHSRQLSKPRMSLKLVQNVPRGEHMLVRGARPRQHNVRLSHSPNSNLSDLEEEESVSPGGGGRDRSDADRLAADFPLAPASRRFRDWRAIWAMRRRSMFSSGWNRRHRASPTVGSTSWWCRTHHNWYEYNLYAKWTWNRSAVWISTKMQVI